MTGQEEERQVARVRDRLLGVPLWWSVWSQHRFTPRRDEAFMSMASLERAILTEARVIFKNKKLRLKDLREWSTGKVAVEDGEVSVRLPRYGVNCVILKEHDRR